MNAFLLKRLAVALTVSQIFTRPDVKTHFDPQTDQKEVIAIINQGCHRISNDLGDEFPEFKQLDIDQLIDMVMANAKNSNHTIQLSGGLDLKELKASYQLFCQGQDTPGENIDVASLINYYDDTVKDLPDPAQLKTKKLPESSLVLDESGKPFTEVYQDNGRRQWLPIAQIPDVVQKAFIAAEDKRFYVHHGVDEHGVIRAAVNNASGGNSREQGGSTITQQVVKNLLVGDELTFERKIREMIVARRLEKIFSKKQILELYLNYVFLGRASWGIEMAAKSYFGKSARDLNLSEAAFLAGLTKGPNYFNPDRYPDRSLERTNYVLTQMKENGFISDQQLAEASEQAKKLTRVTYHSPRSRGGFYFIDELVHSIKTDLHADPSAQSLVVHSTIQPALQSAVEGALQEGLARYELNFTKPHFSGPEKNLTKAIEALKKTGDNQTPIWQQAIVQNYLPLYDVQWPAALVLSTGRNVRVGLKNGHILPLKAWNASVLNGLKLYDVVRVVVKADKRGKSHAELRFRPTVQGAAMVVENATGRVLAMSGGFSYPLSQWDRAVHMVRQPGSTIKPLTYLAALNAGLQPNTLIWDAPISIPPIDRGSHFWSPFNYDRGDVQNLTTIRRSLENSLNRVTARLLYGITGSPPESLDRVRELIRECGADPNPQRQYSIIIGGIDVSMANMVDCFATIANGGFRPTLHFMESVDRGGQNLFRWKNDGLTRMQSADDVSLFQLRTLLQGVIERGTAYKVNQDLQDLVGSGRKVSDFIAGKTGTSQESKDAWFMGFTNDLTIAVWVGYDNSSAQTERSLGKDATGAGISGPIFESILRASVPIYPLKPFPAPSGQLAKKLIPVATQLADGRPVQVESASNLPNGVIVEYFRADAEGNPTDSWQRIARYEPGAVLASGTPIDGDSENGGYDPQDDPQRPPTSQPYDPYSYYYGQGQNPYSPYGYGYPNGPMEDPSQRYQQQPAYPGWN